VFGAFFCCVFLSKAKKKHSKKVLTPNRC